MIVRLTGTLTEVGEGTAVLERDGMAYEVLVAEYTAAELRARVPQEITLHTLQYFEGSAVGGNLIPRLVGFIRPEDRAFFTRFTTVKGLGVKKALKALTLPTVQLAGFIESGDTRALAALPGVGKRMADTIVAELKGKVIEFVLNASERVMPPPVGAAPVDAWTPEQRDALEVMVALGERRADAQRWLERAIQLSPDTQGADEWVRLAYKARSVG